VASLHPALKTTVTPVTKKVYELYFGRKFGEQDNVLASDILYSARVVDLGTCFNGERRPM
jgi:hypothetical protein